MPSPDPLQYPAVSGTVISSAQWNSNFWKSYNDINAIASALNSCSYSDGNGVTSVVATSPLAASIGGCVPGTGTQLTISLAGGATFPAGKFVATNSQDGYNYPGALSASGDNISLGAAAAGIGPITCDSFLIKNTTTSTNLMCIDGSGNGIVAGTFDVLGGFTAGGNIVTPLAVQGSSILMNVGGPNHPVPYDVEGSPSLLTPINHKTLSVLYPAHSSDQCYSAAYDKTYASTPNTWYQFDDNQMFTGGASVSMIYDNGSTNGHWAFCLAGTSSSFGSNITTTITLFALGQ